MSENIEIRVEDKVSPGIDKKLQAIENRARSAHAHIERLNKALAALQPKGLAALEAAASRGVREIDRASMAAQRLATEQQKTAKAAALAATAQTRLAAAAANTAASSANAATAAARLQAAQAGVATATARTVTEQTRGAQAAQRVATEQARTAQATANAAAAADRAALASLRLAQAQTKAGEASQRAASGVMSFVRSAVALTGLGLGAGSILAAADAYTVLQNKLQNVSESQAQNNRLTREIFELANKTRTPVNDLAAAYARFDAALQQTGASQKESLRITETVTKALKVGGSTASETGSALLQLSQAFNKGKLNGDEFRSLMENMPVFVKKAIAEAAKVPLSGIFDAAASGKITINTLREAFEKLSTTVDEKFGKTIPTIGEAITVFKNQFTQAWGEINKSLGITSTLSALIIGLANNLDILAVAVAAVGGAMVLYFGPNLIAMFASASRAVKLFTLAIAANPIGLIAVAISTALVALIAFSDRIKLTADGAVTLRDAFVTAWAYIKDGAAIASAFVKEAWNKAITFINALTNGWGEKFRDIGGVIMAFAKQVINQQIAGWGIAYQSIVAIWSNLPAAMELIFITVVNIGIAQVEKLVNSWQMGLRAIASATESVAPDMAKSLNSALDSASFKLPRVEGSKEAKSLSSQLGGIVKDAFSKDYVGDATTAFMKRARDIAAERRKREMEGALRGTGKDLTGGGDGDSGKSAEKRAKALMMVNKQLDDELSRMFMLKPEREIQQKFDQIESQLLSKKIKLTAEEAAAIKDKLKAIESAKFVQQEFDRIYEAAIEPARTRNAVQEAANKLLAMGAITQEQYNREIVKSSEAYKEATDPLYRFNREIEQNIELLKVMPAQREIEQKLQQISNDLLQKGIVLTAESTAALRQKLEVEKQLNDVAQIQNQLYADSAAGRSKQFGNTLSAIGGMQKNSPDFTKNDAVGSLAQQMPEMFAGTPELMEANIAKIQEMYTSIDAMRQQDLISEQTAAAMRFKVWSDTQNQQLSTASNFFGSLSSLQSSENKKMAAVGKAAAIAQAIINTYQAATGAYASMAAIPFVGPFLGVAAAGAAVAAGLANVAKIRSQNTGFREGGYTGNIPTTEIAGPVHGKEFVFDAPATSRIGVQNLEAMRRGMMPTQVVKHDNSSSRQTSNSVDRSSQEVNYNQTVNVSVEGKRDGNRTVEQQARAIRKQSTRELIKNRG